MPPSSRGLGYRILSPAAGVRIPVGVPLNFVGTQAVSSFGRSKETGKMGASRRLDNLVAVGTVSALLIVMSGAGGAAPDPRDPSAAAARYLEARQKLRIMGEVSPETLASSAALRSGMVVELAGEIVGHTEVREGNRSTYCLLLRTADNLPVSLECPEQIQGLRVGEVVQVLATVPQSSTDGQHFRLNYLARQYDLPADKRLTITPPDQSDQRPASPEASGAPTGEVQIPPSVAPGAAQSPVQWNHGPLMLPPRSQRVTPLADDRQRQKIEIWKAWVKQHNPKLTDTECELVVRWVIHYSTLYGVDHRLIFAVIEAESDFDPTCVSHKGATGLMQLMRSTAKDVQVSNRWNVQENIRGGIQYLAKQFARYEGRSNYAQCVLGLACYNAGPNAVKKHGGVPPYPETQRYVAKVTERFNALHKEGYP